MAELTERAPRRGGGLLAMLRAPVSGWAWRATIHHVVGFPLAIVTFVVTVTLLALTVSLAITAILALASLVMLLWSLRAFTAAQRSRFRSVLGVEIPPLAHDHPGTGVRGLLAQGVAAATWRQITYHILALVMGTVSFVVVTVVWSTGAAAATVLTYARALPDHNGLFGWNMQDRGTLAWLTVGGLVLLLMAPWIAQALADMDVAAARALLGPSRVEELARRVDTLTTSREGVVDAADAERRRIERDLHDGTQQRLVSLAMNLGMARGALADAPEPARRAVEEAHEEAKRTLTELRGFIRGLHPAVLDDRGLDAALSGIAARAPLPVTVRANVPRRCSPTIEAVAYFVVSEALTNVARHAGATRAEVVVEQQEGRLRVTVSDDGHGGAAPERGTGLHGLAQRVASVDGMLRIDSPAGGPTAIVVELPCER
ncbi:MAG TPA: sensor histidine kinase [Micromonosporaceae bacterium]|jgi:signal transduction histidine kinase